jgi:hypothetical protein
LTTDLRRNRDIYGDIFAPRNIDLVTQYLVNMETYTMKDLKRVRPLPHHDPSQLKVKDFPPGHTWFNSKPLSF